MIAIGILLFDQIEALDFAGPYEVFTTASRVHKRQQPTAVDPFKVFSVAATIDAVRSRAGLRVLPDYKFTTCPVIDVLIVPGGVIDDQLESPLTINWLRANAAGCTLVASVCTGAFLLAKAGLLDGKTATTHWEDQDDLRRQFPALAVQSEVRWVDTGKVITSAGISAGMDMCLHIVERLAGRALADATARQLEYVWHRN
jgi:transcriptional regulator GlxA family with amidase domain